MGVDGTLFSAHSGKELSKSLATKSIELVTIPENLVDAIWEDRPGITICNPFIIAIPSTAITYLSDVDAGESINSKIERVRKAIKEKQCDSLVITTLDAVCWLLNIRGDDIQYNPYVYSYVFLDSEKVHLFIHSNRIPADHPHFAGVNIEFHPYDEFYSFIEGVKGAVCYDEAKINYTIFQKLSNLKPKHILECAFDILINIVLSV